MRNSKDEEPFPLSLTSGRACRAPCRRHCCCHSSYCFSILLRRLSGTEGADRLLKTQCPTHRVCGVCQCHSDEDGVWFFKHLILITVEQPQNCLMFSFYSRPSCPQITVAWQSKKKNLSLVTSNLLNFNNFGWLNIKFSICDKLLFQLIFLTSTRKPLLAQLKSSNLIFTILMVMMFGA